VFGYLYGETTFSGRYLTCTVFIYFRDQQRWSPRGCPWPRGQFLKSLASKVKSSALSSPVL